MAAMADILPYRSPRDRERTTAYIGMIIFMGAWGMMFACLFFAYATLRTGAPYWPPAGQPQLPIAITGLNTAVLVASSALLELGIAWTARGRVRPLGALIAGSAVLGTLFLVLQYVIGADLYHAGLTPRSGPYASVFYGLAGIHALHVVVGVLALFALAAKAVGGAYSTAHHLPVRLWSMYWHFVGVVWVLMFVFVFVL